MQISVVHACESKSSHEPVTLKAVYVEGEYSRGDIQIFINDYKIRFQAKRYSVLKIITMDVSSDTGHVEILENLDLKNELPKRTIINPSKKSRSTTHGTPAPMFAPQAPQFFFGDLAPQQPE